MKIAVVKPSKESLASHLAWNDGLCAALKILGQKHDVKFFSYAEAGATIKKDTIEMKLVETEYSMSYWLKSFGPKLIIGWGTSNYHWNEIQPFDVRKILLFAGGNPDSDHASKIFSQVVVESESDAPYFPGSKVAFGTNTELFRPLDRNKLFPSLYPAAFALWKRHDLWAESMPAGSLACGLFQDHEKQCYEICVKGGHLIMPHVSADALVNLYNESLGVCITAERIGGSQRTALEAMACNIPVLATNDSKAAEFDGVWSCPPTVDDVKNCYMNMLAQFEVNKPDLRKIVLEKYSEKVYADKLREVIE